MLLVYNVNVVRFIIYNLGFSFIETFLYQCWVFFVYLQIFAQQPNNTAYIGDFLTSTGHEETVSVYE